MTGEVAAHFADIYGATVSKDTITRITDKVIGEMTEWCNRPLEPVYSEVFIDAIFVKIRDGQVGNRPIYVAIGVTCAGERDILGRWAGDGGEGAKFWLAVPAFSAAALSVGDDRRDGHLGALGRSRAQLFSRRALRTCAIETSHSARGDSSNDPMPTSAATFANTDGSALYKSSTKRSKSSWSH